jgi:hypothetical protein
MTPGAGFFIELSVAPGYARMAAVAGNGSLNILIVLETISGFFTREFVHGMAQVALGSVKP